MICYPALMAFALLLRIFSSDPALDWEAVCMVALVAMPI
jgi:hypothetical protein